jgi:protein-S-isoprenylcysteine O-methyltransferase Ste14
LAHPPPADRDDGPHRRGTVLVVLQLALLAVLVAAGAPGFVGGHAPVAAWLLAAFAVLLGAWSLSANRPGNFNIRPTPREGGHFVGHGPYRWIRHPMYTSLAAFAAAAASAAPPWAWLAASALAAVLVAKAELEERLMTRRHPQYADYRSRTWRFLPGVF